MLRTCVLLLLLAACRATSTYTGVGDVVEVDEERQRVTIDHDDIPGLMGAMTMAFPVRSPEVFANVPPGARVRFAVEPQGDDLVLTRMTVIGGDTPRRSQPGAHSHAPVHGGVVTMVGMLHLEVVAQAGGRVRVYLSDVWRTPLPTERVRGTITLARGDGPWSGTLRAGPEALEVDAPPFDGADVVAHVVLERDGSPIEAYVSLRPNAAAGVTPEVMPCLPVSAPTEARGRLPRCAFDFGYPVTIVAAAAGTSTVLVAVEEGGVTAWQLPEGRFVSTLENPPAPSGTPPPQHQSWGAIALSPDGRQAVVGMRQRLLRYAVGSGRLLRELPPVAGGLVREVVWSGDGAALAALATFDPAAHVLDPRDGRELRRLELDGRPSAVAFAAERKAAALATEEGAIAVFDASDDAAAPAILRRAGSATRALVFVGGRLLAAGDDGVLRCWEVATRSLVGEERVGAPIARLAADPGGRLVASTGADGLIRLHDGETGRTTESLAWHRRTVTGLAWIGDTLVSADVQGRMALWDLARPLDGR